MFYAGLLIAEVTETTSSLFGIIWLVLHYYLTQLLFQRYLKPIWTLCWETCNSCWYCGNQKDCARLFSVVCRIEQGVTSKSENTASSVQTEGRTYLLWGLQSTGTICPEFMESPSREVFKTNLDTYWRAILLWTCFGRAVGRDNPWRFIPSLKIDWMVGIQ